MSTFAAAIPAAVPIHGLHHFAYRCRDAEETRAFYEDILGLPLFHYIRSDIVPSTGEYCPYVHIFFRMTDGSCLAFFDPNGIRLELCAQLAPSEQMFAEQKGIHEKIAAWSKEKAGRLAKK